jgi:hypothetical protein
VAGVGRGVGLITEATEGAAGFAFVAAEDGIAVVGDAAEDCGFGLVPERT